MDKTILKEIIDKYGMRGALVGLVKIEIGHINDTYAFTLENGKGVKRYILQRINRNVFKDIEGLIANIVYVTEHLRAKLIALGRDASREAMRILPVVTGEYFYCASDGMTYRIYDYIENSVCHIYVENTEQFRQAALTYAEFQKQLADIDVTRVKDTIEDFHNTRRRYERFADAVKSDNRGRAQSCAELIDFVTERESYSDILVSRLESGDLPYRVTHNDTKINNVLFDIDTDKGLCVIDLDTIMKGSMLYDFGDAIRFGASSAKEDEAELDKVNFIKERYEVYEEAYISTLQGVMTPQERALLPDAPLVMTYELVIRFLTDYLQGDVYFKTRYPEHNYYRARCQAKLLKEMERWRKSVL